jgi:hypothetical protein
VTRRHGFELSLTQAGKNLSLKPCTLTLKELEERLVFIQITPRQLVERESIDHGAAKVCVRNTQITYEQLLNSVAASSVADPGSLTPILIFTHSGSWIQKRQQKRAVKKN